MYEIATIGDVGLGGGARAFARRPIVMGGLSDLQTYATPPVLIGAGAGVIVGLVLGAVLFGGRRGR